MTQREFGRASSNVEGGFYRQAKRRPGIEMDTDSRTVGLLSLQRCFVVPLLAFGERELGG
jgi:hypothetical protein